MKAIVITDNNMGAGHYGNNEVIARPPGAQIVGDLFAQNNYDIQTIDFFGSWDHAKLLDLLTDWVNGEKVVVSFSVSLSFYDAHRYQEFGVAFKERNPQATFIIGGVRYADSIKAEGSILFKDEWLDVVFLGRSMKNFDNWLKGNIEALPKRIEGSTTIVGTDKELEKDFAVIHKFQEQDLWCEKDIATFEISLGCKFNCSFCNYDFKNIKNPDLADAEQLHQFFLQAYEYGVTNFYFADDTVNESVEKLDIFEKATENLPFKPRVSGFFRIEMFAKNYEQQLACFKNAEIMGMYFGLETWNKEAGKTIGKAMDREKIKEILRSLKKDLPGVHLFSSFIVGLRNDNYDHMFKALREEMDEGLLDARTYLPLALYDMPETFDSKGQIEADPIKYGFQTFKPRGAYHGTRLDLEVLDWRNEWTTSQEAGMMAKMLNAESIHKHGEVGMMSSFAFAQMVAFDIWDPYDRSTWKYTMPENRGGNHSGDMKLDGYSPAIEYRQEYIDKKTQYLKDATVQ